MLYKEKPALVYTKLYLCREYDENSFSNIQDSVQGFWNCCVFKDEILISKLKNLPLSVMESLKNDIDVLYSTKNNIPYTLHNSSLSVSMSECLTKIVKAGKAESKRVHFKQFIQASINDIKLYIMIIYSRYIHHASISSF